MNNGRELLGRILVLIKVIFPGTVFQIANASWGKITCHLFTSLVFYWVKVEGALPTARFFPLKKCIHVYRCHGYKM